MILKKQRKRSHRRVSWHWGHPTRSFPWHYRKHICFLFPYFLEFTLDWATEAFPSCLFLNSWGLLLLGLLNHQLPACVASGLCTFLRLRESPWAVKNEKLLLWVRSCWGHQEASPAQVTQGSPEEIRMEHPTQQRIVTSLFTHNRCTSAHALSVYVLSKFKYWNRPNQCMVLSETFEKWVSQDNSPNEWDVSLGQRLQRVLGPFARWDYSKKTVSVNHGADLSFLPSKLGKINFCSEVIQPTVIIFIAAQME